MGYSQSRVLNIQYIFNLVYSVNRLNIPQIFNTALFSDLSSELLKDLRILTFLFSWQTTIVRAWKPPSIGEKQNFLDHDKLASILRDQQHLLKKVLEPLD